MPRPALTPIPTSATAQSAPCAERPLRSRARPLATDAHIVPHQHDWSQFTYCARGLLQVTVTQEDRETTFIVPPSRAVWVPAQVQHTVVILETAELRVVDIAPYALPASWNSCQVLVVSALLRELVLALHNSTPGARDDALMALVLDEMTHADTQALGVPMPHPLRGDKRLRALCDAVLRDPAEKSTLRNWAASVGASERTMTRLFREELGTSYQRWRTQAVLANALPQLARGLTIAQVAAASGYASDSAFSAMFKQAMGKAPSFFQQQSLQA